MRKDAFLFLRLWIWKRLMGRLLWVLGRLLLEQGAAGSSKALGFFNPIFALSACHRLGWRAGRSIDSDTHINLHPLAL